MRVTDSFSTTDNYLPVSADHSARELGKVHFNFRQSMSQAVSIDRASEIVSPTAEGVEFASIVANCHGRPKDIDDQVKKQFSGRSERFEATTPYSDLWLSRFLCKTYVSDLLLRNWATADEAKDFPGWNIPVVNAQVPLVHPSYGSWKLVCTEPQLYPIAHAKRFDVIAYAELDPRKIDGQESFAITHWGMFHNGRVIGKINSQNVYRHEAGGILDEPQRIFIFRNDRVANFRARSLQGAAAIFDWTDEDGIVFVDPAARLTVIDKKLREYHR